MNWERIVVNIAVGIVSGSAAWMLGSIMKLKKDMNHAYKKIRALQGDDDAKRND